MRWLSAIALFGATALPLATVPLSGAYAIPTDPMIEGAKLCTRHLPRYEREYAIPTHLLSAIASTESGRYHEGLRMQLPWPWAVNAAGRSYYYDTKKEAIAAVKKLRARGINSIDVGCMQVNLTQHPDAFASLEQAFEPQTNVAYAASFLHTLYESSGSWKKAATYYHSRTSVYGKKYVGRVYNSWYQIIDKLRAARLHVPESSVVAMNELKGSHKPAVRTSSQVTTRVTPHVIRLASAQPTVSELKKPEPKKEASKAKAEVKKEAVKGLPEQAGRKVAAYKAPHMKSIKVTTAPASDVSEERIRSIIIVRQEPAGPASTPATEVTASTQPLQTPVPGDAAPASQGASLAMSQAATTKLTLHPETHTATNTVGALPTHIRLASERRPVMATVGRKDGPSFIFSD